MLAYSTYSEAGGVGKSTTAANLAAAHARAGLDVLVVPLDPQEGDLSFLMGVDDRRTDDDVDTLAHHMIERPKGDFDDLIVEADHGVDIIPEHNSLGELGEWLNTAKKQAEQIGDAFNVNSALLKVLKKANVRDRYDVLIADPPATEGPHLHNAINATRSLVIPFEPTAKGEASVDGLEQLVDGLEEQIGIEVGVLAVVPTGFEGTNDQREIVEDVDYPTPEIIRKRGSLMEGCWRQQCSAFRYVQDHRDRQRDYELETLAKFDRLARFLEENGDIEAPNPPEPGALEVEA